LDRPSLLVVDDDTLVLRVLDDTLSEQYRVTTAESGQAALEHLERTSFSVLLADQRMPGMTGVELAGHARALQPHLVTVLLSAYTDPVDMIAAINEGQIFRFMRKPWDVGDLLLTIGQANERHLLLVHNAQLIAELERRLRAVEILHDVLGAAAVVAGGHPADVLLERLGELLNYDLAGLLLVDTEPATVQLVGRAPVSEAAVSQLFEQLLELLTYAGGEAPATEDLRLRITADIAADAPTSSVESQVQVPLRVDDRVVGLLAVQSFSANAFPEDATRLLDLLANGTADALARMRVSASRQWLHLEQALAGAPEGIVLADVEGTILVANHSARRLLAGAGHDAGLWSTLGFGPRDVAGGVVRRELVLGDVPVEAQMAPAGAGEAAVVVLLRDVTESSRAEGRRRELLSTLSHEIRTPLTSVIATLELLLTGFAGDLNAKQTEYLTIADKASNTLNDMISNLLDLERFAGGNVELARRSVDLESYVADLVARYDAAARERGLTLAFEAGTELPRIEADPQRIEQVVGNLLSNATKFAREKSTVRVTLFASALNEGWMVLGISNRGDPISPGEWATIFDRFRQATSAPEQQRLRGTGLGLAICRSITEAHGGTILAESGVLGTTLWVALPLTVPADPRPLEVRFAPVWVESRLPDADRVAVAATLARSGLGVQLLPLDAGEAQRARAALGDGIVVTTEGGGEAAGVAAVAVLPGGEPSVADVGAALAELAGASGRDVVLHPPVTAGLRRVFDVLGLRVEETGAGMALPSGTAASLVAAAEQLSGSGASVRVWLRRARGDTVGVARLRHLDGYSAVYGASREAGLRAALRAELEAQVANLAGSRIDWLALPDGVVITGPAAAVTNVLSDLDTRFAAVARLHYRKEDRKRGYLLVGDTEVPLVSVVTETLSVDADEDELLSAVGS